MKRLHLLKHLGIAVALVIITTQPTRAEKVAQKPPQSREIATRRDNSARKQVPITDIPHLSEISRPYTSVKGWLAQQTQQNQVVQAIGVRLSQTASGLEVILETPTSDRLQITSKSEGNSFTAIIFNAQLRLREGNTYRSQKPALGITEITVTNQGANNIKVTVTGEAGVPKVELFDSDKGLIFSFTPITSSTQKPQIDKPSSEPPTKPSASGEEPIELVVTGEQEDSYNAPNATTATRVDVPLRDIPQSIQVIPRQIIEDRQVVRLSELADNVSGVQPERGYGGLPSLGFRIRGFITNFETLRNGFPDYGYFSPRDVANIERLEILKGPAAVLYGGSPTQYAGGSGVVNTTTKKPLGEPYYNANLTYGSYNFFRPTLDISGPLTNDKSVLYRLNVAYENADSFRDFVENESFFVSPVVQWKISDRTNLSLEYEHQKYNYTFEQGFPIQPEVLKLPRNRFLGEPDFANGDINFNSFTYVLEHKFSDNWQLRQGFNFLESNLNDAEYASNSSLRADRRTLNRIFYATDEKHGNITLQNSISGKFSTGPVRHNLLFGLDYARNLFSYIFGPERALTIDIFSPRYGGTPTLNGNPALGRRILSENVGLFAQDLVELLPNVKLLLGGRLDFNDYSRKNRLTDTVLNEQSKTRFSPRVGIVYQPSDPTSLFFNWSNGFSPQFQARSRTEEQFEPQTTEQFEFGIKQNFLDNRVSATLAFFQITKQNVLTPDPVDSRFRIQTGEQRSRGIELDIAGEILPGWKVIANYAYIDAEVTKDNVIPVGDRLFGVPEHSAGLWTTYEIQRGSLQGLGFGFGLYFIGEQEVILPNTFTLPSYFRTEASIFYRRNNYRFAVNFKNLSKEQLRQQAQTLDKVTTKKRIFWYDSENPPLTAANWGMPNHIIELAGGENIFKDIQGKRAWVRVNWEDVIARQPDAIVLIDASWSPAEEKRQLLKSNPAYSKLKAVQQDKFIVLGFSYTSPGIRNVAGVRKLAQALYQNQGTTQRTRG